MEKGTATPGALQRTLQNSKGLVKIRLHEESKQGASPLTPTDSRTTRKTTRPITTQTVPYTRLSRHQQRPAATARGRSKKNTKHPVWKDATLDGRRKSKSAAAQAKLLHAFCFPRVKEFNSGVYLLCLGHWRGPWSSKKDNRT